MICNETRPHHQIPLIFPYILVPISTLALLSHDPDTQWSCDHLPLSLWCHYQHTHHVTCALLPFPLHDALFTSLIQSLYLSIRTTSLLDVLLTSLLKPSLPFYKDNLPSGRSPYFPIQRLFNSLLGPPHFLTLSQLLYTLPLVSVPTPHLLYMTNSC